MKNRTLEATPLSGHIGAEISGIDLSEDLSDERIAEIRNLLLEHLVVFFRDQNLTAQDLARFARRFGDIYNIPFIANVPEQPGVIEIIKEAEARNAYNFGGVWHSDASFEKCPAMGSILYAIETPLHGGDTLFTNGYAACDALSDGLRRTLDDLKAMHSGRRSYGSAGRYAGGTDATGAAGMSINANTEGDAEVAHPVLRTHPETGRKALFVNDNYTIRFESMTEAESVPLLEYLCEHARKPEFTCQFRWTPGAVAFWDNRCTMHKAINDYDGYRRRMLRTTVAGDRPF